MALNCPNKSSKEWQYLSNVLGEKDAYRFFIANAGNIPDMAHLHAVFGGPSSDLRADVREDKVFEMKKKVFGEVKNIKDLDPYFKNNTASMKPFSQYDDYEFADSLLLSIKRDNYKFSYAGRSYDFENKTDDHIRGIILNEIMRDMRDFERGHKKRIIEWISKGANLSDLPSMFPGKREGSSKFSDRMMTGLMQKYLGGNPNTRYVLYSELNSEEMQKLGIPYDAAFEGYDPIIAIHETNDGSISLSIFDTTTFSLHNRGINPEGNNLFSNFNEGDFKSLVNGVTLQNTEAGVRQFYLGLLAMKMKHTNRNIHIKDVAVLGLYNNSIDPRFVILQSDFLPSMESIRKIKKFMDLLPKGVSDVINNENLYKAEFDQPFLNAYRGFLLNEIANKKKLYDGNERYVFADRNALNILDSYRYGQNTQQELIDMLKNRMNMLQNKADQGGVMQNEEYRIIAEILKSLRHNYLEGDNETRDTSGLGYFLKNLFDTQSDLVQWARNEILRALNFISEKLFAFKKEHNKQLDTLSQAMQGTQDWSGIQKGKERILDVGGDRFSRLFKTYKAKDDKTGEMVDIQNNQIHFSENDPETKKALAGGTITKAEVTYGAWIVSKIRSMFIDLIMHENRYIYNMQGLNKEERMAKAGAEYIERWKDGMVPVVQKSFSERISSSIGDIKGTIKQFHREMGNLDILYHDQPISDDDRTNVEVFNGFLTELGSASSAQYKSYLGSKERMEKMGLAYDVTGDVKLVNKTINNNISTNLENIMDYFMLMGIRKQKMDKDVLPMVNAARTLLHVLGQGKKGIKQENNTKALEVMVDKLVHGKTQKDPILGIDFDPMVNTMLAITTFNGLALNIPVAAASLLMNKTQIWTFAISNGMAGAGKFFTQKEASAAMQAIITDTKQFNKMLAIMQFYQVADMNERDLVNNPRHKKYGKQLMQGHYMHIMNWGGDYFSRGWVMTAQMMFEGSWDAHSVDEDGNVKYDSKKDKRFYVGGKLTEDGELKMNAIKTKLAEDDLQDIKQPLSRGYNYEYAKIFKYISDKYVMGGLDPTTYGGMESIFWGRILSQFKKYLPSKAYNAFGRPIKSYAAITPVVTTDKDGKKIVRWSGNIVEGYFWTVIRTAKDFRKIQQMGTKKYWQQMKPEEKYNLAKMAMDLATFAILMGLYGGLIADWDDDEEEDFLKDSRMLRVFKYAALDMVPFAPWNILRIAENPFPLVSQSLRLFNIVIGDTSDWERAVPLSSTIQVIEQTFGTEEE